MSTAIIKQYSKNSPIAFIQRHATLLFLLVGAVSP